MDSFFIPVSLTEARQKKFQELGLSAVDFSLEQGEGKKNIAGFIVQGKENKEKVLEVLNTSELNISSTQYEGVYLVKCKPVSEPKIEEIKQEKESKEKIIDVSSISDYIIANPRIEWLGKNKDSFLLAASKILTPIVEKNIVVHPHHGKECSPINDGLFHIHLWSSSEKQNPTTEEMPIDILTNKVQCRDWNGFKAGNDDIPLEDKKNKWNYASYTKNNFYIHYDCFHFGNDIEIKTFEDILHSGAKYIKADMAGKDIIQELKDEKRKQNIKNLIKICNNRKQTRINELKAYLEDVDKKIISYRSKMIEDLDRKAGYSSELYALENLKDNDKETIERELTFLEKMDKIKKIEISENKIIASTSLILCKDRRTNKVHEIGEFILEVDPTGSSGNGGVRFYNLTRKVNGNGQNMNGPHIYSDGHACLGNAEPTIVELIRRRAFVELFQYLIAFLETANVEDAAGAHINKWPEVSQEIRKEFEEKYGKKLEELY
jgi:hypothetical protein